MQRNGHDQHVTGEFQLRDSGCKHMAQDGGRRMNLVILQQVDQVAQFAIVSAIGNCLLVWREFVLASSA